MFAFIMFLFAATIVIVYWTMKAILESIKEHNQSKNICPEYIRSKAILK